MLWLLLLLNNSPFSLDGAEHRIQRWLQNSRWLIRRRMPCEKHGQWQTFTQLRVRLVRTDHSTVWRVILSLTSSDAQFLFIPVYLKACKRLGGADL